MDGIGGVIFGIIWIVILVNIFSKVAKSSKNRMNQPAAQNRYAQTAGSSGISAGGNPARPRQLGSAFGNAPASAGSGSDAGSASIRAMREPGFSEMSRSYSNGQTKASRLAETGLFLEDRKNDWLAKQLREEAAIKRRGSVYDLGAAHDVNCEAGEIKRLHVLHHNSNGLDRRTFR